MVNERSFSTSCRSVRLGLAAHLVKSIRQNPASCRLIDRVLAAAKSGVRRHRNSPHASGCAVSQHINSSSVASILEYIGTAARHDTLQYSETVDQARYNGHQYRVAETFLLARRPPLGLAFDQGTSGTRFALVHRPAQPARRRDGTRIATQRGCSHRIVRVPGGHRDRHDLTRGRCLIERSPWTSHP